MKTVVNYKTFSSNEEFVKWQVESEIDTIISAQPFVDKITTLRISKLSDREVAKPAPGVFVTYLTEVKVSDAEVPCVTDEGEQKDG